MLTKIVLLVSVSYCCAFNIELDWTYALNNPDRYEQEREAYFGYSVGLVTTATSAWALVGAPRANDTWAGGSNVTERGAVYLCPLPGSSSSPCRQLIVTSAANGSPGGGGNQEYVNLQNHGWLGGSLDLRPETPGTMIATCSPRWINQQKLSAGERYFMNGACYLTSADDLTSSGSSPWRKVIPLINRDKQVIIDDNKIGVYYYELGQAGLSAHVTEGSGGLWLGAPGMQQWTGSVAKVTPSSTGGVGGARRGTSEWTVLDSEVFRPATQSQSAWDGYFGYSVGSGRFFGAETSIVAGSPRHDLLGKVSVFDTTADQQIKVRWEITGPQLGSYFGAAVATGDVDNDGWSELFVGAPLYTNIGRVTDSGLVVIYSRKANLDDLDETGRLVGSGQAGSRFGSAVMVVGDLDKDGYKDLAVGAPYEAEGAGAVYIYRGSSSGLLMTVSQRLTASDVATNLKGFGISLSRGADVDKNGYADFAVGAHEANGLAVVFRTRPVFDLTLQVSAEYDILVEFGITFDVTSCVSYNGYNILEQTGVILNGQVDGGLSVPRAVFVTSGTAVISLTDTVRRGREQCFTFPVKIQEKIEDYTRPLQISFEASVVYNDPGCEKCGIISPASSHRSAVNLPLALGCGPDYVCTPELSLSVSWKGSSTLALRSGSFVTLSVVVSVGGKESSYKGTVKLLLPGGLAAHQPLPYSCTEATDGISCELPNPMTVGEKAELEISVEESGDILEVKETVLQVLTSASGTVDVKKEVMLSIIEDVELVLNGQVEEDLITYSAPPAVSSITYQVFNRGATRINEVRLDINVPVAYEESKFATITPQPQKTTYGSIKTSDCIIESSPSNSALPGSPASKPPYKTSTNLVCGEQSLLACTRVICILRQVNLGPVVTVEVAYNVTVLSEKFGNSFTLALYTNAVATYESPNQEVTSESGVWTTLSPRDWDPPAESTPVWAYVVAVLVGLLILAVVVGVLFKIGFFKRKRPGQTAGDAEEGVEGQGEGDPLQDNSGSDAAAMETTGTTTTEVEVDAEAKI